MKKFKSVLEVGMVGLLSVGILAGCGSDPVDEKAEDNKVEAVKEAPKAEAKEPVKEEVKEEPVKEVKKAEKKDNSANEKAALKIMQDSFKGVGDVEFDKEHKTYKVTPTDPKFSAELLMTTQGKISKDSWNSMKDNMKELSNSMNGMLGDGYSVALMNPVNKDKVILMVLDGIVFYDLMEDIK